MKVSVFEEGCRFAFFQAVRILERLYPDRERVGLAARPGREVVRFGARLSLTFPASEIQQVTVRICDKAVKQKGLTFSASEIQQVTVRDGDQPQMTVNFMGLTGPLGVLPVPYTELLMERVSRKDYVLRDFLDLFNHRMISLFYRAWGKYRFPFAYEQKDDAFSQYLADLIGMGTPGLQGRLAVNDKVFLYYSGLVGQRPRSLTALAGMLCDYFEVPVRGEQFVGRWVPLGQENVTALGLRNTEVGVNTICGTRIWDRQSKFRLRLGPLDREQFRSFLPSGDAFLPLTQLVRLFVGQEYDFDVQLVLKKDDVPACQLKTGVEEGPRLGWSSWLKTREFTRDAEESILACDN